MNYTISMVYLYFIEPLNWYSGMAVSGKINQAARGNAYNITLLEDFFETYTNSKKIKDHIKIANNITLTSLQLR